MTQMAARRNPPVDEAAHVLYLHTAGSGRTREEDEGH
jgi:hypothetical protein